MVQISYPETSLERREPELSFDTKLDGITGLIVADIDTLKSVRIYLIALVIYTIFLFSDTVMNNILTQWQIQKSVDKMNTNSNKATYVRSMSEKIRDALKK